jgi:hypothetical protein
MDMANNAGGLNNKSPASLATPNGEVGVFIIEKEVLLKQTNIKEVARP